MMRCPTMSVRALRGGARGLAVAALVAAGAAWPAWSPEALACKCECPDEFTCYKSLSVAASSKGVVIRPIGEDATLFFDVTVTTASGGGASCCGPTCPDPADVDGGLIEIELVGLNLGAVIGGSALLDPAPAGTTSQVIEVEVEVPDGTPADVYTGEILVTVDWTGDSETGPVSMQNVSSASTCVVDASPQNPDRPRLDIRHVTPGTQFCFGGDQVQHVYKVVNNDRETAVTLGVTATSKQQAHMPSSPDDPDAPMFAISGSGDQDDFPIAFFADQGNDPLPLPDDPAGFTQDPIERTLTIPAGQVANIVILTAAYGPCIDGSCSNNIMHLEGVYDDGTPAFACSQSTLIVNNELALCCPTPGCGVPGMGDKSFANGTPGCDDPACCLKVCAELPFCCGVEWDQACADLALEICTDGSVVPGCQADLDGSGGVGSGDLNLVLGQFGCTSGCSADVDGDGDVDSVDLNGVLSEFGQACTAGTNDCCTPHATPGCSAPGCEAAVCELDPYCCAAAWDGICVDLAKDLCQPCGAGGDCCEANGTPGCDDGDCIEDVCQQAPFCCEVGWDDNCAKLANQVCEVCNCNGPGLGDCCQPNGTPACDDVSCYSVVCAIDPFCCNVSWDGPCIELASIFCQQCGGDFGACCFPGGGCELLSPLDCQQLGGQFQGGPCLDACAGGPPPQGCVDCPAGALPEGEPDDGCGDPADGYNGGCNSPAFLTLPLTPGATYCAASFAQDGARDTDWYRVGPTTGGFFQVQFQADFDAALFLLDVETCDSPQIQIDASAGACQNRTFQFGLAPGQVRYVFVAPQQFEGTPCDGPRAYTLTLNQLGGGPGDCCSPNGTPGCNNAQCQAQVCQQDPFCCEIQWDGACAEVAQGVCTVCDGGVGVPQQISLPYTGGEYYVIQNAQDYPFDGFVISADPANAAPVLFMPMDEQGLIFDQGFHFELAPGAATFTAIEGASTYLVFTPFIQGQVANLTLLNAAAMAATPFSDQKCKEFSQRVHSGTSPGGHSVTAEAKNGDGNSECPVELSYTVEQYQEDPPNSGSFDWKLFDSDLVSIASGAASTLEANVPQDGRVRFTVKCAGDDENKDCRITTQVSTP